MKVNETIAVCKVLAAHGYGAYELTNDCGYNAMTCYPNNINEDRKFINMEGSETDNFEERGDLQMICDEISRAIKIIRNAPAVNRWIPAGADLTKFPTIGTYIPKIKKETTENEHRVFVLTVYKGWIPCSERVPNDYADVLVWFEYYRYGEYNCLYQTYGIGNYIKKYDDWMVDRETGWNQLRVIAWMPLPEPPESEVQHEAEP